MRNFFLDAIRGGLAWAIVFVHIVFLGAGEYFFDETRALIGNWAVIGFIILAGYSAMRYYRPEPYGRYLVNKAIRILPAFAISWIFCLFQGTTLVPGWFIILLLQFYIVFPAIRRLRPGMLLVLTLAALACMLPPIARKLLAISYMGEFLPQNLFWFMVGIGLALLLDQERMASASEAAVGHKFLIKSGRLSYAIFLAHWPVLYAIGTLLPNEFPVIVKVAVMILVGLPATWLAASALMYGVELPAIKRLTWEAA